MALKAISYESRHVHLRRGDQATPAYLHINPQGLVPALELDDGRILTQSLAIIDYLDELVPDPPLLPSDMVDRATVRSLAQIIACDIHPVQNLRILYRVGALGGEKASDRWARHTIEEGLDAFEQRLSLLPGPFCFGDRPTLADICLVPQLGNARRFGVSLQWPRILAAEAACARLSAFTDTAPDRQNISD